ncbi:hypothetical protein D3C80_1398440 [compost metagenome]
MGWAYFYAAILNGYYLTVVIAGIYYSFGGNDNSISLNIIEINTLNFCSRRAIPYANCAVIT